MTHEVLAHITVVQSPRALFLLHALADAARGARAHPSSSAAARTHGFAVPLPLTHEEHVHFPADHQSFSRYAHSCFDAHLPGTHEEYENFAVAQPLARTIVIDVPSPVPLEEQV